MLDLSINLGNLLTIASFLVGGTAFIVAMRSMLRSLDTRMISVESEIKKLTEVLIRLAAYDEQIKTLRADVQRLQAWYDEMRHGKGFVLSAKTQEIRRKSAVRSP